MTELFGLGLFGLGLGLFGSVFGLRLIMPRVSHFCCMPGTSAAPLSPPTNGWIHCGYDFFSTTSGMRVRPSGLG